MDIVFIVLTIAGGAAFFAAVVAFFVERAIKLRWVFVAALFELAIIGGCVYFNHAGNFSPIITVNRSLAITSGTLNVGDIDNPCSLKISGEAKVIEKTTSYAWITTKAREVEVIPIIPGKKINE